MPVGVEFVVPMVGKFMKHGFSCCRALVLEYCSTRVLVLQKSTINNRQLTNNRDSHILLCCSLFLFPFNE